ncbi:hypothetical protein ABC347_14345 [Sphingomonas sp. 1P06PA]|uniref:hypothetical protein n=1 Tax=Sphingomonas sp. 1P06PA TaxID=554121 RepID=UPI0039A6012A
MTEVDRALAQLGAIQAQMAASTRFRGFAPQAVAATGLLAILVAAAQTLWPGLPWSGGRGFIIAWVVAAMVSALVIGMEGLDRARRLHGSMADLMIGSTLRLLLPFGAAGAAVTLVICQAAPATAWILPGLWQMLVALIGFAAVTTLPRSIVWAAGWYFLCAVVVLMVASRDATLSPWMMGIPFGVGQLLVAGILHRSVGPQHG